MKRSVRSLYRAVGAALPLGVRRRLLYLKAHRRWPRLRRPELFTEKVNWRIVHDRREKLSWTCDKLAMKERVARAAPGIRVPVTLWSGTDLDDLVRFDFPERWVLKPNHRSKAVLLGRGRPERSALEVATRGWMETLQGDGLGEWAYTRARKLYVLEEFIGSADSAPPDYKFFVFDGEVALVQVDTGRFGAHERRLYSADWEPADGADTVAVGALEPPPARLAEMITAASAIAADFDFMRVDLYHLDEAVYFGEVTPYPASGLKAMRPISFDRALGDRWSLPTLADID